MLQHYWFIHLGVITELNPWDSFNPGRLDQHLYPVYKKEMEAGSLSVNELYELLGCFWIKFNNHPDLRRLFLDNSWGFPLRKDYVDDINIVTK